MRFTAIMILSLSLLLVGCSNRTILIEQDTGGGGGKTFTYTWTDPGQPAIDPLEDLSGNGNNLTNNGATYEPSIPAYFFDGVDDSLNQSIDFMKNNNSFSFSAWVYRNGSKANNDIFSKRQSANLRFELTYGGSGGNLNTVYFTTSNGTASDDLLALNNATQNALRHITVVCGTNLKQIYMDSVLVAFKTADCSQSLNNTAIFYVGRREVILNVFQGYLTDIRAWDKALNASEIAIVYANGTVSDGLVAWYPFVNQSYVAPQNYSTLQIPLTPEPLAAPPGTFWADINTNDSYIQGPSGWEALS
jgi:hypothetical protein